MIKLDLNLLGYFASFVIAISMALSSIVKFRIINFIGAISFSLYGFLIGSVPVGILNAFIATVDIYYLYTIFSKKDVFESLEVRNDNQYLIRFLEFYNDDIQKFFPGFTYKPDKNKYSFLILRNMSVAGVFLAHDTEENILCVDLDYVIPQYRDFKNGRYIYKRLINRFMDLGYKKVISPAWSKDYEKYLKKMGFTKTNNNILEIDMSL
ncbi:MAG: hypothetical protein ACUVQP_02430 [Bacteroidales bacterium]